MYDPAFYITVVVPVVVLVGVIVVVQVLIRVCTSMYHLDPRGTLKKSRRCFASY